MNSYPGFDDFFEGAEKILEIWFNLPGCGLRIISRSEWDSILEAIGAKIMSTHSTTSMDSYVLSESSLFVWEDHIVIKTCGITALLLSYPLIITSLKNYYSDYLSPTNFFFSHKAFIRDEEQKYPHKSPYEEQMFLRKIFPAGKWIDFSDNEDKLSRWMIFIFTNEIIETNYDDITTEIIMYGLDEDRCKNFYRSTFENPDVDMRIENRIYEILPGATLHDISFDPFGYSVNGCLESKYFTIHVTPQASCSFASFETNLSFPDLYRTVELVIDIFKPTNCCCTVVCNKGFYGYIQNLLNTCSNKFNYRKIDRKEFLDYNIYYSWYSK